MDLDRDFPQPEVIEILARSENAHLLKFVQEDPFGAHVFPGNIPQYAEDRFFGDLSSSLECGNPIHLWAYIPLCRYKCNFCQFPVLILNKDVERSQAVAQHWVDLNIREAQLWLKRVPELRRTPIGEFNLLGGTPSELSCEQLERLITFYAENFNFTASSTIRVEGSPDSLTYDKLACLRSLGCTAVSFGIQSMDDLSLTLANRRHTKSDVLRVINDAQSLKFKRISGDLIYGLLDQSVTSFVSDVNQLINLNLSCVVATKLHLRPFGETGTAIAGISAAPWQIGEVREKLSCSGHSWPSLGKQYQMREAAMRLFNENDYWEHPTMYFSKTSSGAEKWKGLVVDQDKQYVELGIGLGASSATRWCEANVSTDPYAYAEAIASGVIPLTEVKGFDVQGRERRSVAMALSSCQPLHDSIHRQRFENSSLFNDFWFPIFKSLENRGLMDIDQPAGMIKLTRPGQTLVEAIINTELC